MHDDVATPWTAERRAALALLEQGDVVLELPFGYYGQRNGAAAVPSTRIGGDDISFATLDEYAPQFGIITSQSCDLDEAADPPKRPWFMAAPVYERADYNDRNAFAVRIFGVRYLYMLTGPRFRESIWVADLRIQTPFDKALLVGRETMRGFANESDRATFGQRLAQLYSRPAFPEVVVTHVVETLRNWFGRSEARVREIEAAGVRGFMLRVTGDNPYDAQLLIVVDPSKSADNAMQCMNGWFIKAKSSADAAGLNLLNSDFRSLEHMTASAYLGYQPVALDYLRQPLRREGPVAEQ